MAVVGLLETHDFGFEGMLALLEGDAGGGDFLGEGGGGANILALLQAVKSFF